MESEKRSDLYILSYILSPARLNWMSQAEAGVHVCEDLTNLGSFCARLFADI